MICQDRSCTLHVLDGGSATDWSKSIPHRKIISMWHKPRSFQQLYALCNSYSCWMTFSLVGWLISVLVSEICRVKSQLTAATTYSTRVTTTPCKELLDGIVTLPGKCLCGLGICGPSILNEAPHNGRPNRISIRHHIWPFIHTSSHTILFHYVSVVCHKRTIWQMYVSDFEQCSLESDCDVSWSWYRRRVRLSSSNIVYNTLDVFCLFLLDDFPVLFATCLQTNNQYQPIKCVTPC